MSVGDTVKFTWSGTHNVYKMASKTAYDNCDFTGATNQGSTSPVAVSISEAGVTYYACKVGSHCQANQKIMITTASEGNYCFLASSDGTVCAWGNRWCWMVCLLS